MPGTFPTSPMRVAPPSPGPPQTSPVRDNIVEIMSEVKSNTCSSTEKNRGVRRLEGGAVVAIAVMLLPAGTGADGLGDHADICDAGNAQFVYDLGKRTKRHGPIAAQKHGVVLRVFHARRDSFAELVDVDRDRKSTRLNSSHLVISYAVFCLKKKKSGQLRRRERLPRPRQGGHQARA